MGKMLADMDLLVLAPGYPDRAGSLNRGVFIKDQVAELRQHFRKIIVIAPLFRSFWVLQEDRLCKDYMYDNVEVYYPRSSLPNIWLYKTLIDNRIRVVERTIRKHNLHFDLIHAHFTWPSGYIGVRLKEVYGKPVIITLHENGDWFDQEVRMDHPLINTAWSGADALVRVNKKDALILKQYNKQVYFIPNGFSSAFRPIETIIARERLGLPGNAKVIFTLGNLIKRKGFNYLIDAMERICSQRDDVFCFIGGTGPGAEALQGQIDRLNLSEKVKLLGPVPGDTLPIWMNACDLFVLPSLSESFGIVQIEALACGKPVVSARNRGSEEVITSDEHGLLAEPADPESLAKKILIALNREWDREAILEYVEQFTWDVIIKEIMNIYRVLVLQDEAV